ncbi:hypothetical protein FB567DRAFT_592312 [Paraphoma chrysanthemicola]|uniref:Uncharacterized protein n=1 Tax=Paraphoma chrysanthemicola TaxID=798071 RepID=A0A8K0R917_9PLEO|nr:hypothetical protein FB567DRAFT_592312 [Paraphoma chrysanthemicola]
MAPYIPSRNCVYDVRTTLASFGLPNEIILTILDDARYWVEHRRESTDLKVLMDEAFSLDYSAAYPYLAIQASWCSSYDDSETPKLKEVEFLLVSHDQGWTTEDTHGTYTTSSFWEVSIIRPNGRFSSHKSLLAFSRWLRDTQEDLKVYPSLESASRTLSGSHSLVRRPAASMEAQRLHCNEMTSITIGEDDADDQMMSASKEGEHAWYLQSNEVARGVSVFDDEMVPRHKITWGCSAYPNWTGNAGTGSGEGFVDRIQHGDWIVLWARAKRRGWENHILGARVMLRYNI